MLRTLVPPTAVSAAAVGALAGGEVPCLALALGPLLQLWACDDAGSDEPLLLLSEFNLGGLDVECLAVAPDRSPVELLALTADGRWFRGAWTPGFVVSASGDLGLCAPPGETLCCARGPGRSWVVGGAADAVALLRDDDGGGCGAGASRCALPGVVRALCFLAARDYEGRPLVALAVASRFDVSVCVETRAVDEAGGRLLPGPWALRNAHPTTRHLWALPGSPDSVLALSDDELRWGEHAHALPAGLLQVAGACLVDSSVLVSDATGALWAVSPETGAAECVRAAGALPAASAALLALPGTDLLLAASAGGDGALLSLGLEEPLLPGFVDSLAPVWAAAPLADGALALCCGSLVDGSLRLLRYGMALDVVVEGSMGLEGAGVPALFVVAGAAGGRCLLLISDAALGSTAVMEVTEQEVGPAEVPGLAQDRRTVAAGCDSRGRVAQVTADAVLLLDLGPGGGCERESLAGAVVETAVVWAAHDAAVVSVTGAAALRFFRLAPALAAAATVPLPHAAHALAVCPGGGVAVGSWDAPGVLLFGLDGSPQGSVPVPDAVRSLACAELVEGEAPWLAAGTGDGTVHLWQVGGGAGGGGDQVRARRVGDPGTPVELCACPAQRVIVAGSAAISGGGCDVVRLSGSQGARSLQPAAGEDMAWVTAEGALCLGQLSAEVQARWDVLPLQQTPTHLVYHAASDCLVVATQDLEGFCWLRVFSARSASEKWRTRLPRGCGVTALGGGGDAGVVLQGAGTTLTVLQVLFTRGASQCSLEPLAVAPLEAPVAGAATLLDGLVAAASGALLQVFSLPATAAAHLRKDYGAVEAVEELVVEASALSVSGAAFSALAVCGDVLAAAEAMAGVTFWRFDARAGELRVLYSEDRASRLSSALYFTEWDSGDSEVPPVLATDDASGRLSVLRGRPPPSRQAGQAGTVWEEASLAPGAMVNALTGWPAVFPGEAVGVTASGAVLLFSAPR